MNLARPGSQILVSGMLLKLDGAFRFPFSSSKFCLYLHVWALGSRSKICTAELDKGYHDHSGLAANRIQPMKYVLSGKQKTCVQAV